VPYVEVVVNSPGGRESTFVYAHDESLPLPVGSLVLVPFGTAEAQAIVVGIPDQLPEVPIRSILGPLDAQPVTTPAPTAGKGEPSGASSRRSASDAQDSKAGAGRVSRAAEPA